MADRESGVALVSVLIIVALVGSMVAAMFNLQNQSYRITKRLHEHQQSLQYLLSTETWIVSIIREDNASSDDTTEDWATDIPPIPIPDGQLAGKIVDQQAKINLNALYEFDVNSNSLNPNKTLIEVADRLSSHLGVPSLSSAVYAALTKRIDSGGKLADPSILLEDDLFGREEYLLIQPFITTLPRPTAINVNTASPELLQSLHPSLDKFTAGQLVDIREQSPFTNLGDFYRELQQQMPFLSIGAINQKVPKGLVDIRTEFFALESEVNYGDSFLKGKSVVERAGDSISLIHRQYQMQ